VERDATAADMARLRSLEMTDVVLDPNFDLFAGRESQQPVTESGMLSLIDRYMGSVVRAQSVLT
jgi:hypothetical protein